MKIFFVGFMGSGKTTLGRKLASLINFDFIDTDHYIEQQYGLKVSEIFAQKGETAFRKIEHETLIHLLESDQILISTGGGMPCFGDNMDLMLDHGKVVYLKTSPKALALRLLNSRTERPLIKDKTKDELLLYIEDKLNEREPFYNKAHHIIQTEDFSFEQLIRTLNLRF